MFRWNLMLRNLFASRRQQPKARRPKARVQPRLEALEDRTLPSVSLLPPQAIVYEASPAAALSVQDVNTLAASARERLGHLVTIIQQDAIGDYQIISQEIVQLEVAVAERLDQFFGIPANTPNQSSASAMPPSGSDWGTGRGNSSGAGSGSGAATTANNSPKQPINNSTQQTGRGSGSGSSATTTAQMPSGQAGIKAQSLNSAGTGSGSFGIGGSGTGSLGTGTGSGSARVGGQVWLDNDGDGVEDNGELGYSGIEVDLIEYSQSQPGEIVGRIPTFTGGNGVYSFSNISEGPDPKPYAIQVIFSSVPYVDVYATQRGPDDSKIDGHGTSAVFYLNNGAWEQVKAGIDSMDVNTVKDNPNGALGGNLVTLRDAIKTGNQGGGLGRGPNIEPVRFIDTANKGQSLAGVIILQKKLDDIQKSYNVDGPGSATLTVNGQSNAGTIFTVDTGVTSIISGLTITGGAGTGGGGVSGGGISNNGDLTLSADIIDNNEAGAGGGGGVFNSGGAAILQLQGVVISNNEAITGGGLANAGGNVTISGGSVITESSISKATVTLP